MKHVTIFSQPGCPPCLKVKAWFSNKGVEYIERDVTTDPEALKHIRDLGYMGVPVIETADKSWSGINLENMKELINV